MANRVKGEGRREKGEGRRVSKIHSGLVSGLFHALGVDGISVFNFTMRSSCWLESSGMVNSGSCGKEEYSGFIMNPTLR